MLGMNRLSYVAIRGGREHVGAQVFLVAHVHSNRGGRLSTLLKVLNGRRLRQMRIRIASPT